jgi:hypothetical protein
MIKLVLVVFKGKYKEDVVIVFGLGAILEFDTDKL